MDFNSINDQYFEKYSVQFVQPAISFYTFQATSVQGAPRLMWEYAFSTVNNAVFNQFFRQLFGKTLAGFSLTIHKPELSSPTNPELIVMHDGITMINDPLSGKVFRNNVISDSRVVLENQSVFFMVPFVAAISRSGVSAFSVGPESITFAASLDLAFFKV